VTAATIREEAKMLVIDENKNIQVSQYDTFSIRFRFTNYKLTNGDKVVFAIKKTTNSSEVVYSDNFYNPDNNFVDVVVPKGASGFPGAWGIHLRPGHYEQRDGTDPHLLLYQIFHHQGGGPQCLMRPMWK
jgi:hypothetical protein